MNLSRIAMRVLMNRVAGPTHDILVHLQDGHPSEIIKSWVRDFKVKGMNQKSLTDILQSSAQSVYGESVADEARSGTDNAVSYLHEILHKVVEPDFILYTPGRDSLGLDRVKDQTSRSVVESVIDEMIVSFYQAGKWLDFDNAFNMFSKKFKTVKDLIGEFDVSMSSDVKKKYIDLAVKNVTSAHPDWVDMSSGSKVYVDGQRTPIRADDAFLAAVESYMASKLPEISLSVLTEEAESKFKNFMNLSKLKVKRALSS